MTTAYTNDAAAAATSPLPDAPATQPHIAAFPAPWGAEERSDEGGSAPQLDNTAKSLREPLPLVSMVPRHSNEVADNSSEDFVAEKQRQSRQAKRRNERWRLMDVLWQHSMLDRVRDCGRAVFTNDQYVEVRKTAGQVGYSGLATCGSVWACPRCSAKIQAERRAELEVLFGEVLDRGDVIVAFSTKTLRHKKGQDLHMLWGVMNAAAAAVGNATKPKRIKAELGHIGYIRNTEVTFGGNGWHPHIHAIHLFDKETMLEGYDPAIHEDMNVFIQQKLDALADAEFSLWKTTAKKRGLGQPLRKHSRMDLVTEIEPLIDYMTKSDADQALLEANKKNSQSVNFEMTSKMSKQGRQGSRTPWQILADFRDSGDMDDLALWNEYEMASKGRRFLVWSKGLKEQFLIEDKEDEEIAEEVIGSEEDTVFWISDWQPMREDSELAGRLLNVVQAGGLDAALAFCRRYGVPHTTEPPAGRQVACAA